MGARSMTAHGSLGGLSHVLRVLVAFVLRDLREDLSYRAAFVFHLGSALVTLGTLLFFSRLVGVGQGRALEPYGGDYFAYGLLGLLLFQLQHTAVAAYPQQIRQAQLAGTLEALLATPTPPWLVLLCSPAYRFGKAVGSVALLLVLATWVGKVDLSRLNALTTLVGVVASLVAFAGFGFGAAAATMLTRRPALIGTLLGALSTLIGGVLYPSSVLPPWARLLGFVLPITHGLEIVRRGALTGTSLAELSLPLGSLLAFDLIAFPLGLWAFGWTIRRARRDGSLSHY